jgi:hypothetical protein
VVLLVFRVVPLHGRDRGEILLKGEVPKLVERDSPARFELITGLDYKAGAKLDALEEVMRRVLGIPPNLRQALSRILQ